MRRTSFVLLLLLLATLRVNSAYVTINCTVYYLNDENKTAEITYGGDIYYLNTIIPSEVTYDSAVYSVTSIGDNAFEGFKLTSITIPSSVTSIGERAFSGCSSLDSVFINSNTIVSKVYTSTNNFNSIFGTQVKEYVLGDSVTSIGDWAFYYCSGLTSITIPEGVTSIGDRAFSTCSGLTSITIPSSVTSIGYGAFYNCSGLTSITIPEGVTSIGNYAFSHCSGLTSITIPNSVTSIGGGSFEGCIGLDSITIPNSITSIGGDAFWGCTGLTSITIPNSITSIGECTFYRCSGLTSITIPNSVTDIGYNAFEGYPSLDSVYINSNAIVSKKYTSLKNLNSIFGDQVKTYVLGDSITSIGDCAFIYCDNITSIIFPNSIKSIERSSFNGCSNLQNVKIRVSDYNTFCSNAPIDVIKSINKDYQLIDANGNEIKEFIIPEGVTSIGNYTFYYCRGLTSVTIPNNVTSIGEYAFYGCSGLTSVSFPDSITHIGNYAFDGTEWIDSLPDGLAYIGLVAFKYVGDISDSSELIIKEGTKQIASYAFDGCSGLSSITIPESVTSIGYNAFDGCKLETVLAKNPLTTLYGAFSDRTFQHAMLYIPVGTWRQAIYDGDWYQFNNIREVTTNSQSLSPTRAYTMMRAQDYKYAIYNGADNNVNIVNAFYSVDEDDPNSSWQIIDQTGGKSVMNIGSKKYLNVLADGKLALSDSPVILNMSDTDGAIAINGAEQEWMFVTNNNINVASGDNPTKVDALKDNSSTSAEYYSIDGIKLSEPRNGLNIIRTQDGKTKKILNNR